MISTLKRRRNALANIVKSPHEPPQDDPNIGVLATITDGAWTGLMSVGALVARLLATFFLARLLTPADFGTSAVACSIALLAGELSGFGMQMALLRRKSQPLKLLHAVTFLQSAAMLLLMLLVWLAAPKISLIFNTPQLGAYIAFAMLASFASAVGSAAWIKLAATRRFLTAGLCEIIGIVIASVIAVGLAYGAAGALSGAVILVGAFVLQHIVRTAAFIWVSGYKPKLFFRWRYLSPLWPAARSCYAASILDTGANSIDRPAIAQLAGNASAGYYHQSLAIAQIPAQLFVLAGSAPLLGALARQPAQSKHLFERFFLLACALAIPACFGLATIAAQLIPLLLGPGWDSAVPVLHILCIAVLFRAMSALCRTYAVFASAPKIVWMSSLVLMCGMLLSLTAMSIIDTQKLYVAPLLASFTELCFLVWAFRGAALMGSFRWITQIWPIICAALIMTVLLQLFGWHSALPQTAALSAMLVRLITAISLGIVIYIPILLILSPTLRRYLRAFRSTSSTRV